MRKLDWKSSQKAIFGFNNHLIGVVFEQIMGERKNRKQGQIKMTQMFDHNIYIWGVTIQYWYYSNSH